MRASVYPVPVSNGATVSRRAGDSARAASTGNASCPPPSSAALIFRICAITRAQGQGERVLLMSTAMMLPDAARANTEAPTTTIAFTIDHLGMQVAEPGACLAPAAGEVQQQEEGVRSLGDGGGDGRSPHPHAEPGDGQRVQEESLKSSLPAFSVPSLSLLVLGIMTCLWSPVFPARVCPERMGRAG